MARILIIDDDPSVLSMLRRAVERAGHEVSGAGDGRAGLAQLAAAPFDLVVTDIVMPEMEGIELIGRLRRGYPDLPVIAMSGGGRGLPETYLAAARGMGAASVLIKPFAIDDLLAAMDALLERE
jgi:DNA-binding response OmpR family regulator